MKILIIHYRYYITGGPERYLFNLMNALEDRGHEVVVFSRKLSQNVDSRYKNYWVDNIGGSDSIYYADSKKSLGFYIDMMCREYYSLKCKRALKRLIKDTRPDICYLLVYKGVFSPSIIDACKEMNIPIVNRISDYNPMCGACSLYRAGDFCKLCFYDHDKSCLKYRCVKGSLVLSMARYLSMRFQRAMKFNDKIDAFVCTNGFMKEMFLERQLASEDKLFVIPTFFHKAKEAEQVNKELSSLQVVRFLFIGNIDESKGIYDLLEALKNVVKRHRDFHLDIVGGLHVSENKKVMSLIAEYGLKGNVDFLPFKHDGKVFEYYSKTHVTILPARWPENLPNTLVESLYFHRPVVVPNGGSFKYTTDNSVAFHYEERSVESLTKVLTYVIENPNEIQKKSDGCKKFFDQHFSEEKHLNALISLFNKISKK